jgi:hypothetical protein
LFRVLAFGQLSLGFSVSFWMLRLGEEFINEKYLSGDLLFEPVSRYRYSNSGFYHLPGWFLLSCFLFP